MTDLPPNFRPGAFAGLADDYVRYRLPYPLAMLDDLVGAAQLPPNARLLDLGCGTGRVSLPIASHFANVVAVDPEPEMIAAAQREAARQGVANVRWVVGAAEAFEAPPASFDLITCGESFHRFDQPRVAALAFGWLRPGGRLATLGTGFGEAPWRRVVADVLRRYVGTPALRLHGSPNPTPAQGLADQEAVLRAAGFDPVISYDFDAPHEWTLDELLGFQRSTSTASRRALGERHAAFEAALTDALLAYDPSGRYAETASFGYTLARKPAA